MAGAGEVAAASASIAINSSGSSASTPAKSGPIEPQPCRDRRAVEVLDQLRAPAERGRGIAHGAERMSNVELGITERALAIFPGLAPIH